MTESVSLPPKRTALQDANGEMSQDWYAFVDDLSNLSGATGPAFPQYEVVQRSPLSLPVSFPSPTATAITASTLAYEFSPVGSEYLYTSYEIPRGADANKDAYPFFIFATKDDTAGAIVWTVDYAINNPGSATSVETNITFIYTLPSSGRAAGMTYRLTGSTDPVNNELFPGASLSRSSVISVRVGRDGGHASDTYANSVWLLSVGALYHRSNPGSVDP